MIALMWLLSIVPAALLFIFAAQCFLALFPVRPVAMGQRRPLAVLIPAHNEALVLGKTLEVLRVQLTASDCLCVVADNCTDETAKIARQFDADVVERHHETDRGKGFALAAGMAFLGRSSAGTPEVVVVVDADCHLESNTLDALACAVDGTSRPVQALYLMQAPPASGPGGMVSAFAFLVKNQVRPRGLHRLGLPVPLTGTGMAFPWELLAKRSLASGDIVEDMTLGVDLIVEGAGAVYLEAARVNGQLPSAEKAVLDQRTRWEHGHLQTILRQTPRLLLKGKVLSAMDLMVPPLALLASVSILTSGVLLLLSIAVGVWPPFLVLLACGLLAWFALILVWARFARGIFPFRAFLSVPGYVMGKITIYRRFAKQRETKWVRTQREGE